MGQSWHLPSQLCSKETPRPGYLQPEQWTSSHRRTGLGHHCCRHSESPHPQATAVCSACRSSSCCDPSTPTPTPTRASPEDRQTDLTALTAAISKGAENGVPNKMTNSRLSAASLSKQPSSFPQVQRRQGVVAALWRKPHSPRAPPSIFASLVLSWHDSFLIEILFFVHLS